LNLAPVLNRYYNLVFRNNSYYNYSIAGKGLLIILNEYSHTSINFENNYIENVENT